MSYKERYDKYIKKELNDSLLVSDINKLVSIIFDPTMINLVIYKGSEWVNKEGELKNKLRSLGATYIEKVLDPFRDENNEIYRMYSNFEPKKVGISKIKEMYEWLDKVDLLDTNLYELSNNDIWAKYNAYNKLEKLFMDLKKLFNK